MSAWFDSLSPRTQARLGATILAALVVIGFFVGDPATMMR